MLNTIKKIKNFEYYFITTEGSVYSNKTGKIVKMNNHKNGNGYLFVYLYKNKKPYKRYVHRLVAEAFIENPEHKLQVNHKDSVRSNNHVNNLEWVTNSENQKYAFKEGYQNSEHCRKPIVCIETGVVYLSLHDAERELGISYQNIMKVCKGQRKTAGKLSFKYM